MIFWSKLYIQRIFIVYLVRNTLHEIGRRLPGTLATKTKIPIPKEGQGLDDTDNRIKQKKFIDSIKKISTILIKDKNQAQVSTKNSNPHIETATSDENSGSGLILITNSLY